MTKEYSEVKLSQEEWETIRDGFADIACWFYGFKAARGSEYVDLPPQLDDVRSLVSKLKNRAMGFTK